MRLHSINHLFNLLSALLGLGVKKKKGLQEGSHPTNVSKTTLVSKLLHQRNQQRPVAAWSVSLSR